MNERIHDRLNGFESVAVDPGIGAVESIRRRLWLIVILGLLAGSTALVASAAADSSYRASTKLVVGQGNSLFEPADANAVQVFTATMSDLVQSNVVAGRVELGPVGLGLFLVTIVAAVALLVRSISGARSVGDTTLERLPVVCLLIMGIFLVSTLLLSNQFGRLLWILTGLAIAIARMSETNVVPSSSRWQLSWFRRRIVRVMRPAIRRPQSA